MIVFEIPQLTLRMHLREIQQTLRRLRKSRGFCFSVVLTLGLGIGATVSVFSIIYAVLITSLPYQDPSRLFSVFQSKVANDEEEMAGFAPGNFRDFRAHNRTFTDLAPHCVLHYNLTGMVLPEP